MAHKSTRSSDPIKVSDSVVRFNVEERLPKAIEKQTSQDLYSNYVHVVVSEHEVMFDFYRVSRIPGKVDIELVHLQKLFLPLGVGKRLIGALETTLSNYEKSSGIKIESPEEDTETEEE